MKADLPTLTKLSWDRLREAVAARTATPYGRELAENLLPGLPPAELEDSFSRTEEVVHGGDIGLRGIREVRPLLERIEDGNMLEGTEILEIAWTFQEAGAVKRRLASGDRPALAAVAAGMAGFDGVLRLVREQLDREGNVRDGATPKLREIRRRLNPLRGNIRERLQRILDSRASAVQEPIITQRRDRYVIPVKASFQAQVPGIVLDSSDSGATVFVEPQSVVGLNNELALLQLEERDEVRRILIGLGQRLAFEPGVAATLQAVGVLDLAGAGAALANDWNLVRPGFTDEVVELTGLRHPFVDNCVPNDLKLDPELRLLVVTGPNAGGKTVLIKALGLAALMASAGLFVAVRPGSSPKLPRFRELLIDIGDEQSIEASLSTYAAHLVNLKRIAEEAAPDVLVLIDELGSGTDPAEGAALSQAILEEVLRRGSLGLVTTHLGPLKVFAAETAGLENAAMKFDVDSLSPTFELTRGQPGRSYALAIAERLGLPGTLLERAEEVLGPEGERLEGLLETLEQQREELGEQLAEARTAEEEAVAEAAILREQIERLRTREEQLLADAAEQADRLLEKTMRQARDLRRAAGSGGEQRSDALRQLQELRHEHRSRARRARPAQKPAAPKLGPGARVRVESYGAEGQVLEVRDSGIVVQLGLLRVTVAREDVELLAEETARHQQQALPATGPTALEEELDLRGERVDEGLEQLRDYLLEAHALKKTPVRILHGKGTGALRDAVRRELGGDPRVQSFADAPPYEGGHGVTVVNLSV